VDPIADAKANVLRHSGTAAEEAALRLLGPSAEALARAERDPARRPALADLYAPAGAIFRAARLSTAERRLERLLVAFAAVPLDAEAVWAFRRDLWVLESMATPVLASEVRELRGLVDGLLRLAALWRSARVTSDRADETSTRGAASAAAALFLERLKAPEANLLDLLLEGLPFVLGYLRDRSVAAALNAPPPDLVGWHLPRLQDELWSLASRGGDDAATSFERIAALDQAMEAVLARIRGEESPGAQLAAVAGLYRLVLCVRTAATRDLVRRGIEALRAAAARELGALGVE
jgi:hypothetical protein